MKTLFRKLEMIEALPSGGGIQHILDEAYKIVGNPMMLQDVAYKLIAHTKSIAQDDPLWIEITTTGTFGQEALELFKEESFIDTVANCKTTAFLVSERLKYDRLFGKVVNKQNLTVANLIMVLSDKPVEGDDPLLFEAVCNALSKKVSEDDFYYDYGIAYVQKIVKELIDGNIGDRALYSGHVANIDAGLKNNLFVGVADISGCDPTFSQIDSYRNTVKRMQPMFKCALYDNHIVMIMSSDSPTLNIKKDLGKLRKFFEQKGIYVGISGCFENIFELNRHYRDAVLALAKAREGNGGTRICQHE